jgi:hypothetical protein
LNEVYQPVDISRWIVIAICHDRLINPRLNNTGLNGEWGIGEWKYYTNWYGMETGRGMGLKLTSCCRKTNPRMAAATSSTMIITIRPMYCKGWREKEKERERERERERGKLQCIAHKNQD